ncbi:MAG TPA: diacylglycerol kinase family protein [Vicinamibacterales bacterium]|nr:diacylglycerol kinase family protein [Vicinamibacterales bacterium]
MTRALLVVNPSSGRELATASSAMISERLREQYSTVDVSVTQGDGDAGEAAGQAVRNGCDAIIVAGGDGTLNEVFNAVVAEAAIDRMTFGIIPMGTGNDFSAALGIRPDVDAALQVISRGRTVAVDVGMVNGRAFLNTSGGGFIAEVSIAVTPQLKTIAGRLAYLVGGTQVLMEYDPVRATVTAEPDGIRIGLGLYAFAVCNSPLIGGGRLIAPRALLDDGLLDVCLIEAMSSLEFVALARKVAGGDHVADDRVRYLQASSVRIEVEREIHVNTDGEVFPATVCEYTVLPRAATFLVGDAPFMSPT